MGDTQKIVIKDTDLDNVSDKNRDIDTQLKVPLYMRFQSWTGSVYFAAVRLLIILFGFMVLSQIHTNDTDIVEILQKLFKISMEHGNIGYLAIATAFYFLAKNILLFVNQNRSK